MISVHVFVSIWDSTISAEEIAERIAFPIIMSANKGDKRGTSTAIFKESYCRFDAGIAEIELESEITERVIASILSIDVITELARGGSRIWISAIIPKGTYELSIAPDEMLRLGAAGVGLSYDISQVFT